MTPAERARLFERIVVEMAKVVSALHVDVSMTHPHRAAPAALRALIDRIEADDADRVNDPTGIDNGHANEVSG